jgi:hypothetical protein
VDKPESLADSGPQDEAEKAAGGVVIPGCRAPTVFEPVEELLDSGTQGMEGPPEGMLHEPILLRGYLGTARTAKSLVLIDVYVDPLAPAAQWCARTMVLSII